MILGSLTLYQIETFYSENVEYFLLIWLILLGLLFFCLRNFYNDFLLNSVEPNVVQPPRPCDPNPCGTNAQCKEQNGAINCVCPTNYIGDPYSSCRPECVLNTDCPRDQSCVRNRCVDPCAGTCGINADCRVANHIPVCSCKESYTGDPYGSCRPIPAKRKIPFSNNKLLTLNQIIQCSQLT